MNSSGRELGQSYKVGPLRPTGIDGQWCGSDGRVFYLKVIPDHSRRDDTDEIYQQLASLEPKSYGLARPIQNREGRFVTRWEGQDCLLIPWVDHESAITKSPPLSDLLAQVSKFHADLLPFTFPDRPERTYESYLRRGLRRIEEQFGDHAFLRAYRSFIDDRLPDLDLPEGNIHFDLGPSNVWTDFRGKIIFADFDDVQRGPFIKDYCQIAAPYFALKNGEIPFDLIRETGLAVRDLKALLLRNLLPEVSTPANLDDLLRFLGPEHY